MFVSAFAGANGQSSGRSDRASTAHRWTLSIAGGAFVRPTVRTDGVDWLRQNHYDRTGPTPDCWGFDDAFFSCATYSQYPFVLLRAATGWVVGIRRTVTDRYSVEMVAADEPNTEVAGYCVSPPAATCGTQSYLMTFYGRTMSILGAVALSRLHIGAGPALSLQHWNGSAKTVPGVWLDATVNINPWLIARSQYRRYVFVAPDPALPGGVRHSLVFLGLGIAVGGGDR
jgi:hypothetical protein